jgi:zinc D-Ala-D-Ala dipeptidase
VTRAAALAALVLCCAATHPAPRPALPAGFVYLSSTAPSIVQDVRYAGGHNLVGRALRGYLAPACVLTRAAARALAAAQRELLAAGLTLRVYDCYRPQRAVDELFAWARDPRDQSMKAEYYPRVLKGQLFALGYLEAPSSHSRGSAVDLTIQRLPVTPATVWVPGEHSCVAAFVARYHDGSIDMGTNYGCMDPLSRVDASAGAVADSHRNLLRELMEKHGFVTTGEEEWWHFTLRDEPFPKTYFDFPVTAPP